MEEPEDNMVQVRKSHKVEQMVSKWLCLTRDSSQRNQATADEMPTNSNQLNIPLKVTVKIDKDPLLDYGFLLSKGTPICVNSVTAGGPGEGKLFAGEQVIQINNIPLDSISQEHIDNIIRECGNSITVTVLRNNSGPKSSFITDEKRARLKSNPVKVRFAEEVIVNGHTQVNSLLFMPNVLKIYLENGQTKAFRYDKNTTVKDIILTLKSKLSICCIEYFALALKERYSVTKVYLLHDDELIEQVVQKREPRDYKCLFRVCFLPRDPLVVLQDDPVTFDYLYLQSCNDVLQERFAVEMKCSTAIRLAALQIQECILSSKQSQKISIKYIEKDWGIESFVSPTILHNMKEKDVRKAINYHLKNNQSSIPPGQKHLISPTQLRLNYLNILSNLRTYGGKTFHATLMLQDRESFITLLVGAKYGISQIINSKLNILNQLTNFNNIRKLELTFECDKISMVNIYLEDMKSLSLLMESHHAKDLVCSIAGYYKLYVNSRGSIFTWPGNDQTQPLNTEEGDETRGLSDSESLSDMDSSVDMSVHKLRNGFIQPLTATDEDDKNSENEATDSDYMQEDILEETSCSTGDVSDFNDEISQGGDTCERSCSADSLEELQMETSMSSLSGLHSYDDSSEEDDKNSAAGESGSEQATSKRTMESEIRVPQLPTESPISTQTFSEYNNIAMKELVTCRSSDLSLGTDHPTAETRKQHAEVVDGSDTQGSIACALTQYNMVTKLPPIPSPVESTDDGDASDLESTCMKRIEERWNVQTSPSRYETTVNTEPVKSGKDRSEEAKPAINAKERFTPQDAFDVKPYLSHCYSKKVEDYKYCYDRKNLVSRKQQLPTFCSVASSETESALLEPELISPLKSISVCINKKAAPSLMEMEPDTMEIKSVTEAITVITPVSAMRYPCDSGSKMGNAPTVDGSEQDESISKSFIDVKPPRTACSKTERSSSPSEVILELGQLCLENPIEDKARSVPTVSCTDEQQTLNTISVTGKDQNDVIIESSTGREQGNGKCGPWADFNQSEIALRQMSCQDDLRENTCTFKVESDNCGLAKARYQQSNGSAAVQRHLLTTNGDQGLPQMSVLQEEISDRRNSSLGDNENRSVCPLDRNRLVLDLNHMSFKTFGAVKHFASPTSEPKMEVFSVRPQKISNLHTGHGKGNQSKVEPNSNHDEYLVPPTQINVDNFSAPIPCLGNKDTSHKISSETTKSKPLYELEFTVTQKSSAVQSVCSSAKFNNLNGQEEEGLGFNVDSENLAILTTDRTKQLSTGGKEACSCQMVYGNCFRALGIDAIDEHKELESLTWPPSPKTTPPASGSPLPQGLATFNKQGEETVAAKCYFGILDAVKDGNLVLPLFKDKRYNMPNGFRLVQNDIAELLNILKECPRESHADEDCTALTSVTRQKLDRECKRLMSACQKSVKVNQTPDEMILGVSESFQALSQLSETCFQLTTCPGCAKDHAEVASTLRKVVMSYKIFVQASENACSKMSDDLGMKLLAEQCASLFTGIFYLNQLFTSNSLSQ
ncbi:FERM and PDZ domain-containing protein 1 isoform X2 [Hemitrygon akajei]|uniref:FERM and PDZ domain-containing protein 1 isoform X2 n=1 Tax=Hemitrygon akajei TaxID=2704970 RepID=UPI003BF981F4